MKEFNKNMFEDIAQNYKKTAINEVRYSKKTIDGFFI